ncbi:MAG: T9SS type A sorting domain-containing protein [Bacteroidetes bacterium]|nr:T9SS type A sorting domain-containing protein [Bacteroidota bacterium]
MKIIDMSGRVVLENEFVAMNDMLKVNLEKLNPGVYFIRINSNQ